MGVQTVQAVAALKTLPPYPSLVVSLMPTLARRRRRTPEHREKKPRMAGESAFWAKLLCVGAKEPNPYRVIELSTSEFAVGRKEGCAERISDNTISSVHFRIRLVRPTCDDEADEETAMPEVWLEDGSANGTYVGAQKVGKGNRVRLANHDEIGLIKPRSSAVGAERPPWAFIFQDFRDQLLNSELDAILAGRPLPPRHPTDAAANAAAPPPPPAAAPSSGGPIGRLFGAITGVGSPTPAPAPAAAASAADVAMASPASSGSLHPLMASMQILAAPDPKGLRELRGTLRRGAMDVRDFVSADGPSALLDVVSEVVAKPKLGWIDLEVLDGALAALKELLNAPDAAGSILDLGAAPVDSLVAVLSVREGRVLTKALQILQCLVVMSAQPAVEEALGRACRKTSAAGAPSVGGMLCQLLRRDIEAGVATELLTLLNALLATSSRAEALHHAALADGLDDALALVEPLAAAAPELRTQIDQLRDRSASASSRSSAAGATADAAAAAAAPPT